MDNIRSHHTRAATRDGKYPPPKPLYSPQTLAFGTIEAGALDVPSIAAPAAVRPTSASAEELLFTPMMETPSLSASGAEAISSALPVLTESNAGTGTHDEASASGTFEVGGWTPVTRKTSRSHRERSNSSRKIHTHNKFLSDLSSSEPDSGSESTVDQATRDLNDDELQVLACRHEQIAAQFRAKMARKAVPEIIQAKAPVHVEKDVPVAKALSFGTSSSKTELPHIIQPTPAPVPKYQPVTVEEIGDEDALISFNAVAGPSKGKGVDPRNWGGTSAFQNFSEEELNAQCEMLMNYEAIQRVKQEELTVPTGSLIDFTSVRASTPKANSSRKCLKSPKLNKAEGLKAGTLAATVPVPTAAVPSVKVPVAPVVVPAAAPAAQAPTAPAPIPEAAPAAKSQFAKPESKENNVPVASDRESNNDREIQSGLSVQEMFELLSDKINELQAENKRQRAHPKKTRATAPLPRGVTPGRLAAGNFFKKALCGGSSAADIPGSPPSDPSDDSSSDSGSSSNYSDEDGSGSARRRASSPQLSSKRKRGHDRKRKMLLKPIPPSRHNGDANANAIQRFAREAKTYVKMGRVPADEQVYFVSYYLDGRALDFYNQVVVPDEESWDLEKFFIELFEFCVPAEFRNKQRKRLERCYQSAKDVAAHVAEWSEIWNTIGLEDTQEKIVRLFNSFTYAIQGEIYRKGFDPEESTWDEIVKAAEQAEILLKLVTKNQDTGSSKRPSQSGQKTGSETRAQSGPSRPSRGGFRGRGCGRGGRFNRAAPSRGDLEDFIRGSTWETGEIW
ncbi:hypothetical protein FB451DRAFT_1518061 [Mycena latifolia]|nr:hypothetical protein FB451DRAFT_1518061 [Mycena latifolia]